MPISVELYPDTNTTLVQFYGTVTVADLEDLNASLIATLQQADALSHVVFESSELEHYPVDLKLISDTLTFLKEPQLGWLVMVTDDRTLNFVGSTLSQLFNVRYRSFAVVEDAAEFLESVGAGWMLSAQ